MLKDIILLAIGAVFGLGATMTGVAAPSYFPNAPVWIWHWLFWGGIALMGIMVADGLWLIVQRPPLKSAILINIGLLFISAGLISLFPTTHNIEQEDMRHKKTAMARQWIDLSNDILGDMPRLNTESPTPIFGQMSEETKRALRQQELQRTIRAHGTGLNDMSNRYVGRLTKAKVEMEQEHIQLRHDGWAVTIPVVNKFGWQRWAEKLGLEGRRILADLGADES
jgi:hypothetical protein